MFAAAGSSVRLRVPVAVSAQGGWVHLAREAGPQEAEPEALWLPMQGREEYLGLEVTAQGGMSPASVTLRIEIEPPVLREALDFSWHAAGAHGAPRTDRFPAVGEAVEVSALVGGLHHLALHPRQGAAGLPDGRMRIHVNTPDALELSDVDVGVIDLPVRIRRPMVVRAQVGAPRYVWREGAFVGDPPLRYELVTEGLTGAALDPWLRSPPTLEGDAAPDWTWRLDPPSTWRLDPVQPQQAPGAYLFRDQITSSPLRIVAPSGELLPPVTVERVVPARWGRRGWLLIALATLALLLLGVLLRWLRPPALRGTLLYTSPELPGTVGRLDLERVRARRAALTRDKHGRLQLDRAGDPVAEIRAERVGGVLVFENLSGATERRILVDGMGVEVHGFALRFVTGELGDAGHSAPPVTPQDLLDPSYDMPTGQARAVDVRHPRPDQERADGDP